jgi:hypothetical protein
LLLGNTLLLPLLPLLLLLQDEQPDLLPFLLSGHQQRELVL